MSAGHPQEHHRQISGGWIRAAIFGVSDGLVTNISFLLGFAGANSSHNVVRLAGLATLVAGAFSMGTGEYLSMRAQKELFEYEIGVERQALAERLSVDLMRDPDMALSTHAREELGVDPTATGKPIAAAFSSFGSFAVGAFIPLIPWLWSANGNPILWSVAFAGVGSILVGGAIGNMTRRGMVRWALRQLVITVIAAGVTYGVGRGVGTR